MIGILGGMGPDATVDLMRRVIAATPAEDDADHVHLLVDNNPKVPSRIAALIDGTGESPAPTLARMTRRLVAMGATTLAMPCNTAHVYLPEIRAAAGAVPVLDMVALTAARAAATLGDRRRVGMLASTAVRLTGLYEAAFAPYGVEVAFPAGQDAVMTIIRAVKAGAADSTMRRSLAAIAESLHADGAGLLLIACTELSVIADALPADVPALDAMDVLAAAIVAAADTPQHTAADVPGAA